MIPVQVLRNAADRCVALVDEGYFAVYTITYTGIEYCIAPYKPDKISLQARKRIGWLELEQIYTSEIEDRFIKLEQDCLAALRQEEDKLR